MARRAAKSIREREANSASPSAVDIFPRVAAHHAANSNLEIGQVLTRLFRYDGPFVVDPVAAGASRSGMVFPGIIDIDELVGMEPINICCRGPAEILFFCCREKNFDFRMGLGFIV